MVRKNLIDLQMMINWTELPSEIISAICDYLSYSERQTLAMVNHRCEQIVNARREKFAGIIVRGMPSINIVVLHIPPSTVTGLYGSIDLSWAGRNIELLVSLRGQAMGQTFYCPSQFDRQNYYEATTYYFIDVAFGDGSRLRKEFSTTYCGTTDVKTVLTNSSNPFGCSSTGRMRNVSPFQLMSAYFKCILRRSMVDTLYVGLVGAVPLLKVVDCRVLNIVLPDELVDNDVRLKSAHQTKMTKAL
uniref:F-box domain-containing protein n=1 Tax=Angiostrongylus cantonensis TaxID=6313 RepID=A0A0K0CT47_ANGCA